LLYTTFVLRSLTEEYFSHLKKKNLFTLKPFDCQPILTYSVIK